MNICIRSYSFYSKVALKGLVCDQFIPRLIRLVVSIIWTKAKLLSITLWLVYDCVKPFCGLMLNYNLVVCGMPNVIELCYSLVGLRLICQHNFKNNR